MNIIILENKYIFLTVPSFFCLFVSISFSHSILFFLLFLQHVFLFVAVLSNFSLCSKLCDTFFFLISGHYFPFNCNMKQFIRRILQLKGYQNNKHFVDISFKFYILCHFCEFFLWVHSNLNSSKVTAK